MTIRNSIAVVGGAGFIGRHIVHQLSAAGYPTRILTRRRIHAQPLILLPGVSVVECDFRDDAALRRAFAGCDAVIHLPSILHERDHVTFDAVHVEFPRRVALACRQLGIKRLLHTSALRAAMDAPSAYLRSKAKGELAVREAAGDAVQVTIFRPSVVFGPDDSFLNLFASLVRLMPVIFLAKPDARFQPIYVEDVARAYVSSLILPSTQGQTYELGGPEIYTLRQLVEKVANTLGRKPVIIGLGDRLSWLQAWAMEWLPVKLMTRDNLLSMQVDNTCQGPFPQEFGFAPTPLDAVMPGYIGGRSGRDSYLRFRSVAGR